MLKCTKTPLLNVIFLLNNIRNVAYAAPLRNAAGELIVDQDKYTAATEIHLAKPREVFFVFFNFMEILF